jgi:hypothetical protein
MYQKYAESDNFDDMVGEVDESLIAIRTLYPDAISFFIKTD